MLGHDATGRWGALGDLQREVGRLFEGFEPLHAFRMPRPFPALNLHDAQDRYLVTVELPGVSPDDIELSVTGETLTLRGERKRPEGVADESYRRQERPFGRWSRSINLPERIDGNAVAAEFHNGILTITLPKAEEAKPRQITVTTAS